MTSALFGLSVKLLDRMQEVRVLCGSLPHELRELEMGLQCLIDLQRRSATQETTDGVFGVLDELIQRASAFTKELQTQLEDMEDASSEKLFHFAKSFVGFAAEDQRRMLDRLSRQVRLAIQSFSALSQSQMSSSMTETNELLRAILQVQAKRDSEVEQSIIDRDQWVERFRPHRASFSSVDVDISEEGKEVEHPLFYDEAKQTESSFSALDFGETISGILLEHCIEADDIDKEVLRKSLKLSRGSGIKDIEKALRARGLRVSLVSKPMSGFLEVRAVQLAHKLGVKKLRLKPRWCVHQNESHLIMVYRSPHNMELVPPRFVINLTNATFRKHQFGDNTFVIKTEAKIKYVLRAASPEQAKEWMKRLKSHM